MISTALGSEMSNLVDLMPPKDCMQVFLYFRYLG